MRRIACVGLLALIFAAPLYSQANFQIFPQFVDGRLSDGSYYRSTLTLVPWSANEALDCTLRFYGITPNLEALGSGSSFSFKLPAGGFIASTTPGSDGLQSGYATLGCSGYVLANVLYTLYSPNGAKVSEATVFPADESSEAKLIVDQRGDIWESLWRTIRIPRTRIH